MFDLITTLKEVGLSLEEIKNYMDERDADAFMELLKEQDKLLKQKIEVLTRRRRLLRNTLKMTKEAFDVEENTISIEDAGEEYFIISDRPKNNSEKELFAVVSRLWDYCTKHNAYDDFVTGEIIPYENIVNGSFATGWFSSRVDKKAKSRYLHVKRQDAMPLNIYVHHTMPCRRNTASFAASCMNLAMNQAAVFIRMI